jgi:hypothetical protein
LAFCYVLKNPIGKNVFRNKNKKKKSPLKNNAILRPFNSCIKDGALCHYFFQRFNTIAGSCGNTACPYCIASHSVKLLTYLSNTGGHTANYVQ